MTKPYDPLHVKPVFVQPTKHGAYDPLRSPTSETAAFIEEGAPPPPGYITAYPALEQASSFPLHYDPHTRTAMPVRKIIRG